MAYNVINLDDIYGAINETEIKKILDEFECEKNKDVEYFLKQKSIEFSKLNISRTFLVTSSFKEKQVIVGYFSIANKITKIKKAPLSASQQRRIKRFANNEEDKKYYTLSLPLIGQLGKNFKDGYDKLISGDVLLKLACDKVREAQHLIGGKFVFLECEDIPKLKEFYESNGFVCFGKRNLEKEERENNKGNYLLQMLCDLSK